MEMFVYSRAAIERVPPHDVPHVIISITSSRSDRARLPPSEHCRGVLRLTFLDADQAVDGHAEEDLFSAEQADQIWDFVLGQRGAIARVVVHCDAGVSRSPAVAAALAKTLTGSDAQFFARYRPNMRVYRTLMNRYHERLGGFAE